MQVTVDAQTMSHMLLQYTAVLLLLWFIGHEGVLRRRLARPGSILMVLFLAGQVAKCTTKYFKMEAYPRMSEGGQAGVNLAFGVVGVYMATCLVVLAFLFYWAGRDDYRGFVRRGLRVGLPITAGGLVALAVAWHGAGLGFEPLSNLLLFGALWLSWGALATAARRRGWFDDRLVRFGTRAALGALVVLSGVFVAVLSGVGVQVGVLAIPPIVALYYSVLAATVAHLAQRPELRPPLQPSGAPGAG